MDIHTGFVLKVNPKLHARAERDPEYPKVERAYENYQAALDYGTDAEAQCARAEFEAIDARVYGRAARQIGLSQPANPPIVRRIPRARTSRRRGGVRRIARTTAASSESDPDPAPRRSLRAAQWCNSSAERAFVAGGAL